MPEHLRSYGHESRETSTTSQPASNDARFGEIYGRYEPDVYAYARRRFDAETAQDVVADVFAVAWRKFADAPTGSEILPWLYRIAYLVSSNHRKGYTRRNRLDSKLRAVPETEGGWVDDQVVVRDEVRRVEDALANLSPGDRQILQLSVWEQLTNPEVALVLGISSEAAAQRLHRARRRLTRQFERLERRRVRGRDGS